MKYTDNISLRLPEPSYDYFNIDDFNTNNEIIDDSLTSDKGDLAALNEELTTGIPLVFNACVSVNSEPEDTSCDAIVEAIKNVQLDLALPPINLGQATFTKLNGNELMLYRNTKEITIDGEEYTNYDDSRNMQPYLYFPANVGIEEKFIYGASDVIIGLRFKYTKNSRQTNDYLYLMGNINNDSGYWPEDYHHDGWVSETGRTPLNPDIYIHRLTDTLHITLPIDGYFMLTSPTFNISPGETYSIVLKTDRVKNRVYAILYSATKELLSYQVIQIMDWNHMPFYSDGSPDLPYDVNYYNSGSGILKPTFCVKPCFGGDKYAQEPDSYSINPDRQAQEISIDVLNTFIVNGETYDILWGKDVKKLRSVVQGFIPDEEGEIDYTVEFNNPFIHITGIGEHETVDITVKDSEGHIIPSPTIDYSLTEDMTFSSYIDYYNHPVAYINQSTGVITSNDYGWVTLSAKYRDVCVNGFIHVGYGDFVDHIDYYGSYSYTFDYEHYPEQSEYITFRICDGDYNYFTPRQLAKLGLTPQIISSNPLIVYGALTDYYGHTAEDPDDTIFYRYLRPVDPFTSGTATISISCYDKIEEDVCTCTLQGSPPGPTPGYLYVGTNTVAVTISEYIDYYFVPNSTDTYHIYSTGAYDPKIEIYDSGDIPVDYDDDSGSGSNFDLNVTLTGSERYRFSIYSYDYTGDIDVVIQSSSPGPEPPTPPDPSTGYYEAIETFDNVGQSTYTIPVSNWYKLEVWGAQGAIDPQTGYSNPITGNSYRSYSMDYDTNAGGYAEGEIYLSQGTTLYVNVGGQGTSSGAGYNGGGQGTYTDYTYDGELDYDSEYGYYPHHYVFMTGGNGGGATHIALSSGNISAFSNDTSNLIIVAGGGGGDSYYNHTAYDEDGSGNITGYYEYEQYSPGGSGGGFIGSAGYFTRYPIPIPDYSGDNLADNVESSGYYITGWGGSQTEGGENYSDLDGNGNGLFGTGGSGDTGYYLFAGGGGGFYGGAASYATSASGGGSGWLNDTLLTGDKHMATANYRNTSDYIDGFIYFKQSYFEEGVPDPNEESGYYYGYPTDFDLDYGTSDLPKMLTYTALSTSSGYDVDYGKLGDGFARISEWRSY